MKIEFTNQELAAISYALGATNARQSLDKTGFAIKADITLSILDKINAATYENKP